MMNVVIKSILSLAVIYVLFFNFDTSPIRYLLALAWTYPLRAAIVAVIAAGVVICASKTYQFMRREAKSVERFSERWAMGGISDAHGLLTARKLLVEPNTLARNDEAVLKDFLARYRMIYDALPKPMKAKQEINTNALGLHRRSQLFLLRTNPLKHGILFVIHDDGARDGCVRITDYAAIPKIDEVKQMIGESVPDKHIDLAIKSVSDWADKKYEIHNPDGYGGFGGNWEDNEKMVVLVLAPSLGRSISKYYQGQPRIEGFVLSDSTRKDGVS